ncbi:MULTISPECIES: hypothetical protein [unclassified Bradyrhizobium]|uniref:hypothetical protein n=1 Tax=unclassified Bradyrhizobium TaxID=2631580 RepID=UPI001FFB8650|nr:MULTISPECIES: hypothetical protein [unclassified Bradyrhizobium]MCK1710887.1 hypothetical protein [Bradyrhizobium sp. 143]MCK1728758.1 hypothetical protein [Bradyrhizobium sp. 142]
MSAGASPLSVSGRTFDGGSRYRLRDLFTPLEMLLVSGGDPRLALDPEDCVSALDPAQAQRNVQHVLDRIAHVLVKIELLLDRGMAATVSKEPAFEV